MTCAAIGNICVLTQQDEPAKVCETGLIANARVFVARLMSASQAEKEVPAELSKELLPPFV